MENKDLLQEKLDTIQALKHKYELTNNTLKKLSSGYIDCINLAGSNTSVFFNSKTDPDAKAIMDFMTVHYSNKLEEIKKEINTYIK